VFTVLQSSAEIGLSDRAVNGEQMPESTKNLLVITGPPGSGKTPVVHELVASGFTGVAEPAREVIAE